MEDLKKKKVVNDFVKYSIQHGQISSVTHCDCVHRPSASQRGASGLGERKSF